MLKIRSCELECVCGITSGIPENSAGEFAFAGRSNVGKSSLINALMQRKSFARVSEKPGKTQTINFYRINRGVTASEENERGFAPDCYLVDLPGYGYAGVSVEEKKRWGPMIERYLHGSAQLRAVFLLTDIRHAPAALDKDMYAWIRENGFTPIVIATKKDKVKPAEAERNLSVIRRDLGMEKGSLLIPVSSQTKEGIDAVWETMRALIK